MNILRKTFGSSKGAKSGKVFLAGAYLTEIEDRKIIVCSILSCSPVAICGQVAVGDFLIGVNGKRLNCIDDLTAWIQIDDVDPIWIELKRSVTDAPHHVVLIRKFPDFEAPEPTSYPESDGMDRAACGVGIDVESEEGSFVISKLSSGGSAWLAAQSPGRDSDTRNRLMPGDIIVAVDGRSLQGFSKSEVLKLLSGKIWTRVSFSALRDGVPADCDLIRFPIIPSSKLPAVIKYRSATACLPSLPPSYRTGRCGFDHGTPAPTLAGMDLDVATERIFSSGRIVESTALREVVALLSAEEKWATAALFCSLLSEARLARSDAGTASGAVGSAAGSAAAGEQAAEKGGQEGDAGDWYMGKGGLLVAYLGLDSKQRDFFLDTVASPDGAASAQFAAFFRDGPRRLPSAGSAGGEPSGDGPAGEQGGEPGGSGAGQAESTRLQRKRER